MYPLRTTRRSWNAKLLNLKCSNHLKEIGTVIISCTKLSNTELPRKLRIQVDEVVTSARKVVAIETWTGLQPRENINIGKCKNGQHNFQLPQIHTWWDYQKRATRWFMKSVGTLVLSYVRLTEYVQQPLLKVQNVQKHCVKLFSFRKECDLEQLPWLQNLLRADWNIKKRLWNEIWNLWLYRQ